jgi:hypothetical protein
MLCVILTIEALALQELAECCIRELLVHTLAMTLNYPDRGFLVVFLSPCR